MKNNKITILLLALALVAVIIPAVSATDGSNHNDQGRAGVVFTMTNSATGNAVLAFQRGTDGFLTAAGSFSTGGLGTGASLGNQGGLVLSHDGRVLVVVNAGSNDVSVFRVNDNDRFLTLTNKAASQGSSPISVTVHKDLVYVLNAGTADVAGNIAGF